MRSLVLIALLSFMSITAFAQDTMDALKGLDFGKTSIKQVQAQKLEMFDLKLLRGIIFGRHGRVFKDYDIKSYLEEQPWYKSNPDFNNSMLNDVERRNLDVVEHRVVEIRIGLVPRLLFEIALDVVVFEDAAVTPEDDAAQQLQIKHLQLLRLD